jgi:hypothetical protein
MGIRQTKAADHRDQHEPDSGAPLTGRTNSRSAVAGSGHSQLIQLFQQTPIGSINGCLDRNSQRPRGSFNRSLPPKRHADTHLASVAGRLAWWAQDVGVGRLMNWGTLEMATGRAVGTKFLWRPGSAQNEDAADGLVLAAYPMTIDKRGPSSLLLQRLPWHVAIPAWMMLRKSRRAMINLKRTTAGRGGNRRHMGGLHSSGFGGQSPTQWAESALVLVAVAKPGVTPPGAVPRNQPLHTSLRKAHNPWCLSADRAIGNLWR